MANWYGTSRSNYFKVKDEAAFKDDMDRAGVEVFDGCGVTAGKFAVGASDDGCWPDTWPDPNDETEIADLDFLELLRSHLADGEVGVLVSSGAEKMRYVTGFAVAFDNTDRELVRVDINDIYEKAKEAFGVEPTAAEF